MSNDPSIPIAILSDAVGREPSFADAVDFIRAAPGLTEIQRRDFVSALRKVADWLGQPLENLACSVGALNDALFRREAAVFGIRAGTFRGTCSRLRAVLRLMDRHVPLVRGESMLSPAWPMFLAQLGDHPARVGLRNFARWCDARTIAPEAVTDESLRAFLAEDAATRLSASVASLNRSLPAAWNRACSAQPEPDCFTVLAAPRRREAYTKPFDWYLPSFVADVERYRLAISRRSAGDAPSGPPGRGPRRLALLYGTTASGRRAPPAFGPRLRQRACLRAAAGGGRPARARRGAGGVTDLGRSGGAARARGRCGGPLRGARPQPRLAQGHRQRPARRRRTPRRAAGE